MWNTGVDADNQVDWGHGRMTEFDHPRSRAQGLMEWKPLIEIYESRWWRKSGLFALMTGISFEGEYENIVDYQRQEIPFVSKMVIRDAIRAKDVTTLEYFDIVVQNLPDSTFNLNLLMR